MGSFPLHSIFKWNIDSDYSFSYPAVCKDQDCVSVPDRHSLYRVLINSKLLDILAFLGQALFGNGILLF